MEGREFEAVFIMKTDSSWFQFHPQTAIEINVFLSKPHFYKRLHFPLKAEEPLSKTFPFVVVRFCLTGLRAYCSSADL